MNKTVRFLSIAAVAAFASLGAHADEADASQFATQFETQRTRAEVRAEAVVEAKTHSMEPAGSRVATYQSTADRAAVRVPRPQKPFARARSPTAKSATPCDASRCGRFRRHRPAHPLRRREGVIGAPASHCIAHERAPIAGLFSWGNLLMNPSWVCQDGPMRPDERSSRVSSTSMRCRCRVVMA